jgi:hypothetical protein
MRRIVRYFANYGAENTDEERPEVREILAMPRVKKWWW